MRAISLWQPWASAIAVGVKTNETRSWSTNFRGPLAIHAARKADTALREFFDLMMTRGDFYEPMRAARLFSFTMLPKGAIVAVAELASVVTTEAELSDRTLSSLEMQLGDYGINRFVWRLANVRAVQQPYYIKGHQGFFEVPDDLK